MSNTSFEFEWEETMILAIYRTTSRCETIEKMEASLPYIKDREMEEFVKGVISKVESITDEEFLSIDFESYQLMLDSYNEDDIVNGGGVL